MMFWYMIDQWCYAEPETKLRGLNWVTRCLFVESVRRLQRHGWWRG